MNCADIRSECCPRCLHGMLCLEAIRWTIPLRYGGILFITVLHACRFSFCDLYTQWDHFYGTKLVLPRCALFDYWIKPEQEWRPDGACWRILGYFFVCRFPKKQNVETPAALSFPGNDETKTAFGFYSSSARTNACSDAISSIRVAK